MKKRILIFSLAYYPYIGGAEVAVKEITDRLSSEDFEFDLITARFDRTLPEQEKIGNIMVYRIGFGGDKPTIAELSKFPLYLAKVFFPPLAALKASRLHRKKPYDALWSILTYMGFPALFFKWFHRKIPFILTLQDGDSIPHIVERRRIKLVRPFLLQIFKKATTVTAISAYLARFARSMGYEGQIKVIPNGADTKKFQADYPAAVLNDLRLRLGKKKDDIFLITTSRLVLKNALDDIIKSLKFLPEHVHFIVLGVGPDQAKLRSLALQEGVAGRVRFVGYVTHDDLPKYLKISDIFVRPSLFEGMGNSFIEAMAARVPVIATQEGGIADFLFDPERNPDIMPTGRAVDVRSPEQIAEQVKKYLADKALTKEIVNNAEKLALSRYDWDLIASEMLSKVFVTIPERQ